jgi:hypothetical protein
MERERFGKSNCSRFHWSLCRAPRAAQITSIKSLSQVERLLSGIKPGDVTATRP